MKPVRRFVCPGKTHAARVISVAADGVGLDDRHPSIATTEALQRMQQVLICAADHCRGSSIAGS